MIIWGSTGREIIRDSGVFNCPECGSEENYHKVRYCTYFTLYFIPLFETEHHATVIKCCACKQTYKLEVLDYKPPTRAELMIHSIRVDLESGTPVQMAVTKLVNGGVERLIAEEIVAAAAGQNQQHCLACDLNFVESIARCSSCGGNL
ncbi:zinc-ribbon domain-containing protein [Zavarzinella formosa]|uniref:zinc-ribbon domain-containing protein n=1 Tax=Zavarzinella formosa TaxID=360055 RepID=UPI0002D76091|nr:zinc-ribbon domain-containing protein [Zavarzinella formosa]